MSNDNEIQELKTVIDLVQLVEESGVALRRVGRNLIANCPFEGHDDSEASFVVNPEKNMFNCFGCKSGGDVFSYLQKKEGLTFPQALEKLRQLAGPNHEQPIAQRKRSEPQTDVLPGGLTRHDLLTRVMEVYAQGLRDSKAPQEYLLSRGLGSGECWQTFRLGFANGSLLEALPSSGGTREALTALGVLTPTGRELFSGCVVVPLTHPDEGLVGLYGRKIIASAKVRHLFLPGPHRGVFNWQALQTSDRIVVAESVMDAMSLWTAGCPEVTCLYGTAMPRTLEDLMGRFNTREVRFCLDADEAGREATTRLTMLLSRRGVRCMRVDLPDGVDPNGVLVEGGVEALAGALAVARSAEPPPPGEMEAEAAEHEETGDGFVLRFGQVTYRVTPRPPFTGRMRVTLRVFYLDHAFIDNLDILSHRARATSTNQIVSRMKLGKAYVERHFAAVIEACERWVEARHDGSLAPEKAAKTPVVMTEGERDEALAFLKRPDLVDAILEDMEAYGYTGEERSKLLAYLIGVSRKLERPLSGIIISQSGAGKSALAELVETLTPPENVVLYTRLTAQSLVYLPKDSLKRKLVIIEEREGAAAAEYHVRILQSRQKLTQATTEKNPATGQMQTKVYEVEGPIAYLETTTSTQINYENATRCFELHLDESEEQTRRIHGRQREMRMEEGAATGASTDTICKRHHVAQRLLQPVRVFLPYASMLSFPVRWLRTRRDHERFLSLIDTVAFLHQYQREGGVMERDGKQIKFIRASVADYRLAYQLAWDVLWATLHELTHDGRELLESLRTMTGGDTTGTFTRRDVRGFTDWQDHRLRTALDELTDMEYLSLVAGSQGRTCHYRLVAATDERPHSLHDLTTPEQLEAMLGEREDKMN